MIKLKATVTCSHYAGCLNQTEVTLIVGEAKAFTDNGKEDVTILTIEDEPEGWDIRGFRLSNRAFCPTHNRK